MDRSHSEHSFISALQNLPKGLTATYERIFQKISQRSARQLEVTNKIFDWTLATRRPLTLPELREAIAVDPGDVSLDRSKIPAETDGKRFLQGCGNLVLYDEKELTVQLVHHTVSNFLREARGRHVPSDVLIGDVCMTYLQFTNFETQIVKHSQRPVVRNHNLIQSMSLHIPRLLGIGGGIYDFLLGIYNRSKHRPLPEVDYHELLQTYERKPLSPYFEQFELLDYVRQNWVWHTKYFEKRDKDRWQQLQTLIFSKTLVFDFRPWMGEKSSPKLSHLPLFLWAIKANHMNLLMSLKEVSKGSLKHYVEYLDLPENDLTLSVDLNANCEDAIFELLIREHPMLVSNERWMGCALKFGRVNVLQLMLNRAEGLGVRASREFVDQTFNDSYLRQSGRYKDTSSEVSALKAIHVAAFKGSIELMRLLLIHGANIEAEDGHLRTPLFYACGCIGDVPHPVHSEAVQYCLQHRANVNASDECGETVLHRMITLGLWDQSVILLLMKQRANLKIRNDAGDSVTLLAAKLAPRAILKLMAENGLNLEEKDDNGNTLLMRAALGRDISRDRVATLLESGAYVNASDDIGTTTLHKTVKSKPSKKLVGLLLDAGADVNACNRQGESVLHAAVSLGWPDLYTYGDSVLCEAVRCSSVGTVELLLKAGADTNANGRSGLSPLFNLIETGITIGSKEVHLFDEGRLDKSESRSISHERLRYKIDTILIQLLLEAGADVDAIDHGGKTVLQRAVEKGLYVGTIELLLKAHADVNKVDYSGKSILHSAVESRASLALIELIMRAGADVNARHRDRQGNPILHEAIQSKMPMSIIELFLKAGASTKATDLRGYTALDHAVASKSTGVVKLLIAYGVDVNSFDYSDGLALSKALSKGPDDMVELILKSGADPNQAMVNGILPIDFVTRLKQWNKARMLLENGSSVQPPTAHANKFDNPFYWVIQGRKPILLRLLLEKVKDKMSRPDLDVLQAFVPKRDPSITRRFPSTLEELHCDHIEKMLGRARGWDLQSISEGSAK